MIIFSYKNLIIITTNLDTNFIINNFIYYF